MNAVETLRRELRTVEQKRAALKSVLSLLELGSTAREAVYSLLSVQPGLTSRQLAEFTGHNAARVRMALVRLFDDNLVTRYGKPGSFRYYVMGAA